MGIYVIPGVKTHHDDQGPRQHREAPDIIVDPLNGCLYI
jgi:hypothetical protein